MILISVKQHLKATMLHCVFEIGLKLTERTEF
jgi:hypothetical protein